MEIESLNGKNLCDKQPLDFLGLQLQLFSKQFETFENSVNRKYDEMKSLQIQSLSQSDNIRETGIAGQNYFQDFGKIDDMGIESTGVSLGTPKDTVEKIVEEEDIIRRQEEKLVSSDSHSYASYFTPDMVEIFHQLFKASNLSQKNGRKQAQIGEIQRSLGKPDPKAAKEWFQTELNFTLTDEKRMIATFQKLVIEERDLSRLAPQVYLNDILMNFYTKLLQKLASRNPETENDFYFFNTYFFEKINEVVEHEKKTSNIYSIVKHVRRIIQPKIEGAHKKLCRWYKKLGLDNLFLKKHLLIPLNKRKEHWSLVIVCNLHNLLRIMNGQIYLEQLPKEERPMILYLDSLLQVEDSLVLVLRMFLESELKSVMGESYPVNEKDDSEGGIKYLVDENTLPCYQLLVPRQRNLEDCGVYVLEYMERFVEDPLSLIEDVPDKIDKLKLFFYEEVDQKRKLMAKFLVDLFNGVDVEECCEQMLGKRREIRSSINPNDTDQFEVFEYDGFEQNLLNDNEDGFEEPSAADKRLKMVNFFFQNLQKDIQRSLDINPIDRFSD